MNALRITAWVGGVVVAAWLQVAWFGHVRPLGVAPNLMLLVVIIFALWSDATPTLAAALGGGLLLDFASGSDFGLRMAFYVVVALALIAGRQLGLHATSIVTGVVATVVATVLFDVVILATIKAGLSTIVLNRIGRELIDNLVLLGLLYLAAANLRRPTTSADLGIGGAP